ncbi:ATP-grasp domain-containing protein [Halalkalibacter krulwichiae]|uniref:Ribosomal protein S6--L-glutamate ligase n=1 Tax=Halalkalibacter krulwichiae TaxID=199441 RepID=A0A1Y9THH0_9BACI|nr:hypothetical protein [Halalkalibacter krulwichiae]ARK28678.1 Ribosomal protein S6--L-glutamate ligase [Halalkalibacter krulwichiae]
MTYRPYLAMIQQSVSQDDVSFKEIAPDYLYRVLKDDKSFLMHDVEIGLNNSSSLKIARSKSGTYSALQATNVMAVEHFFLLNPASRFSKADSFKLALNYFHSFNERVVLKQDDGSQGENVFKIDSEDQLETHLSDLFSLQVDACLSPFYSATYEYRVIMLKGKPQLFLAKERTTSWKHNLIGGSRSIDVPSELEPKLADLATNAALAVELDFCSVDILHTTKGLLVLEINEQVMLDEYIKGDPTRVDKVSKIYREAILERFTRL